MLPPGKPNEEERELWLAKLHELETEMWDREMADVSETVDGYLMIKY